ncbi:hypothetical protein AQUCO_05700025v1 [Aquilegia coerulea]|uniref:F-box associated beta-propeller type 3 domain-containing protein n=1 Tax=Aquilegia coerulea TaxID=218851 RepID=A0A2G5CFH6_AQUCA|nr:hypothetical protein AQUCO_05700025v1 [Aquilegia coerulea]
MLTRENGRNNSHSSYQCMSCTRVLESLNNGEVIVLKYGDGRNNSHSSIKPDLDTSIEYISPQDGLIEADKIEAMPGRREGVKFDQYAAGYVTVDPTAGRMSTVPMLNGENCRSRKQKKEAKKAIMPCLDNDTIFDILTRIPGDLLHKKFKNQCKNWFKNIFNQTFIDTHLQRSKEGILHEVIVNNKIELRFMDLEGLEANKCFCNGLVLVKDYANLGFRYIINPITREAISLPNSIHALLSKGSDLVFIPSTKQYKALELWHDVKEKSFVFHIQTLGSSSSASWRPIKEIESIYFSYQRVSVNGILYINIDSSAEVLSFDVGNEETIRLMPLPEEYIIASKLTWLTKMDGHPMLMTTSRVSEQFDVWMLKDVNQGKWMKQFTFGLPVPMSCTRVLGSLNNGEVIVIEDGDTKGGIIVYYVKTRQCKMIYIDSRKNFNHATFLLGTHVNSLVSPKSLEFGN